MIDDIKIKALERLMPLGGWSYENGEVSIHEDGEAHGYAKPTQTEMDEAVASVEAESYKEKRAVEYPPIGDQLDALWKELAPKTPEAIQMKADIEAVKAKHPKPTE